MAPLAESLVRMRPDWSTFRSETVAGFRGATGGLDAEADKSGRKHGKTYGEGMSKGSQGPLRGMGKMIGGILGTAAVLGGIRVFSNFIADARESAKVTGLTAAAIKSTGGVANVTAGQVSRLATAISNKTGKDDEAIQSGQNMLLTFTNVRNEVGKGNDIFNQSSALLTDMTAAMNGGEVTQENMRKQAIMLGKALNDPLNGLTALRKVGVTFTEQQREQIATMMEAGDVAGAQGVILAELAKEFGGAAAATSDPLDRLGVVVSNLGEELGTMLLPYIEDLATWLADVAAPAVLEFIDGIRNGTGAGGEFRDTIGSIIGVVEGVVGIIKWLADGFDWLNERQDDFSERWKERWQSIKDFVATIALNIVDFFLGMAEGILDAAEGAFGWIPGIGDKLRDGQRAIEGFRDNVNKALDEIKDRNPKISISISSNAGALAADVKARWTGMATGGAVFGAGGPTSDSVLARLSPGEHVWTAREVQAFGGHKAMQLARKQAVRGFAAGGAIRGYARGGVVITAQTPKVDPKPFRDINAAFTEYITRTGSYVTKQLTGFVNRQLPKLGGGAAGAWARSQVGKPYVWGGVGPRGYDCSGFMSAILNVIQGRSPYSRRGSTGTFPWPGFAAGYGNFTIGSFRGNPGHMAGTLNGMNVESRGGEGVVVGPRARGARSAMFRTRAHLRGYAAGGAVGELPFDIFDPRGKRFGDWEQVLRNTRGVVFDQGGTLPPHSATLAINNTSRPEPVGMGNVYIQLPDFYSRVPELMPALQKVARIEVDDAMRLRDQAARRGGRV